jgi:hypothetical protein
MTAAEQAVLARAVVWRQALIPKTSTATARATQRLADAVDQMLAEQQVHQRENT